MLKVSALRFNTPTKTRAPLADGSINNTLIPFIPSCHNAEWALHGEDSIGLMLSRGNLYVEKHSNKFCHLGFR